jgi:HTH-type transcriptional regulator, sugar sensing transcriptional regulator
LFLKLELQYSNEVKNSNILIVVLLIYPLVTRKLVEKKGVEDKMIVKDEFLSKLRRYFGLNLYEVKIWSALLSRGVATAGELSDIANVPRSRSYDVLESLEKKGFVVMKLGKPIKYIAVEPNEVLERVKKNVQKDSKEQMKRLEDLKETDVIQELNSLHKQGVELVEPSDLSGSIRGRHNLYNHLELTIRDAEESVSIMTTTQGLIRKVEGLKPTFEKLKKRGVRIRIAAPITKECTDAINELSGIAEIRHSPVNGRFTLVDGKEIIFMVMNDSDVHPTYDVGIWVNTPFFASAMDSLFDLAWKDMKPIAVKK